METSGDDFEFKRPPYEYEMKKMPFDILSGGGRLRGFLESKGDLPALQEEWKTGLESFIPRFKAVSRYPED